MSKWIAKQLLTYREERDLVVVQIVDNGDNTTYLLPGNILSGCTLWYNALFFSFWDEHCEITLLFVVWWESVYLCFGNGHFEPHHSIVKRTLNFNFLPFHPYFTCLCWSSCHWVCLGNIIWYLYQVCVVHWIDDVTLEYLVLYSDDSNIHQHQ